MTQSQIMEVIVRAMPDPASIREIYLGEPTAVRFTWRKARYRVNEHLFVDTVEGQFLVRGDLAELVHALLRATNK